MEFEKTGEKFQFGFGSMTAAGNGNVTNDQPVPKEIKTKHNTEAIAKSAVKAAVLSAAVLIKNRKKKKK